MHTSAQARCQRQKHHQQKWTGETPHCVLSPTFPALDDPAKRPLKTLNLR
jgi:hypothetical protein